MTDGNGGMESRAIERLRDGEPLDVLVIGGGIVGSGVARDAAMRGLRVGLVDKNDFAFGTSSRSSRLLHGGLRYLAQGRLGLVHEASVEKMTIHKIAPHLAAPLPFVFPTRKGTPWSYWKMRMGVKVYDLLCGGRNLGASSGMSRDEATALLPGLNPKDLSGAVRYFDGLTNDARLVLDTIRSAAANGAIVCNYVKVEHTERRGDAWAVRLRDAITGKVVDVTTRAVVNAAGAWAMGFPASGVKLRLTKGVHLVIDRTRLPVRDAVVMAEGSRILFVIPWAERVILGTTDTDYDGPTDSPRVERDDIDYILKVTNETFTTANLTPDDVVGAWAGLRPLIADPNGKPSDISRKHEIQMTQPGWVDVAGGKLTTYRLMGEQTVDKVIAHLRANVKPCATATTPLLAEADRQFSAIVPPAVSREAVEHFCRKEWAQTLEDVMVRRSSWKHYHRDDEAIAGRVAVWMGEVLGWDEQRVVDELAAYTGKTPGARQRLQASRV